MRRVSEGKYLVFPGWRKKTGRSESHTDRSVTRNELAGSGRGEEGRECLTGCPGRNIRMTTEKETAF